MVGSPWLEMRYAECQRRADEGDGEARFWLGHFHWVGRDGTRKDINEAVRIWRNGPLLGNYKIQYMIAFCYKKGIAGFEKNKETACKLSHLAAEGLLAEAIRGDGVSEQFYVQWMTRQRKYASGEESHRNREFW